MFVFFQAGLEPEAVTADIEDVHMVGEAIEQCSSQVLIIGEDLGSLGEGKVGRHDQAGLFIALAEEAEQVLGAFAVQVDIT